MIPKSGLIDSVAHKAIKEEPVNSADFKAYREALVEETRREEVNTVQEAHEKLTTLLAVDPALERNWGGVAFASASADHATAAEVHSLAETLPQAVKAAQTEAIQRVPAAVRTQVDTFLEQPQILLVDPKLFQHIVLEIEGSKKLEGYSPAPLLEYVFSTTEQFIDAIEADRLHHEPDLADGKGYARRS